MQVTLCLLVDQDGMHLIVFAPCSSAGLCVSLSLCSPPLPPVSWRCTARAVTRVVRQPEKTTDERCGRGTSSVCCSGLVTRCTWNWYCSLGLPCALRCPCLAAAPAGGCLSAERNWVGTQALTSSCGHQERLVFTSCEPV